MGNYPFKSYKEYGINSLSDRQRKSLIAAYQDTDVSVTDILKRFKISDTSLLRFLKENNIPIRKGR